MKKEERKSEVVRRYVEFTITNKHTPEAVGCKVRFGNDTCDVKISFIRYDEGSKDDEEVFYYCEGLVDFLRLLKEENGEDFTIEEILGFM